MAATNETLLEQLGVVAEDVQAEPDREAARGRKDQGKEGDGG